MEYRLVVGDRKIAVDTEKTDHGTFSATIGGTVFSVACQVVDGHWIHLTVEGPDGPRTVNAFAAGDDREKTIVINGVSHAVADADALEKSPRRRRRSDALPDTVTPATPAVVVRVLVAVGDVVEAGQPVVVLSAMKMETTLRAPHAGTVTAVNVAPDDRVSPGQILVDIEKIRPEDQGDT